MSYSESPSGLNTSTISIEETENTHIGPQGIAVFHDIDEGLAYAKKIISYIFRLYWTCLC